MFDFEIPCKIFYEDTDCLGVVYYANYLKFIERARSLWLENIDISPQILNKEGFNIVVYRVNATYHKPAKLGDNCVATVSLSKKSHRRKVLLEQHLKKEDHILFSAQVDMLCLNNAGKIMTFPQKIVTMIKALKENEID